MDEGVFNANRLFAEIKALGYSGGKTIGVPEDILYDNL